MCLALRLAGRPSRHTEVSSRHKVSGTEAARISTLNGAGWWISGCLVGNRHARIPLFPSHGVRIYGRSIHARLTEAGCSHEDPMLPAEGQAPVEGVGGDDPIADHGAT